MKKLTTLFVLLHLLQQCIAQNVGIGTTTPNASALLEIKATDKGILIPRLTAVQRLAIATPANGLMVYDTDSSSFSYYNGSNWQFLKGNENNASGWSTNGNAGTNINSFIGTTDAQNLWFKVNNKPYGFFSHLNNNLALGDSAMASNVNGSNNIAIGTQALMTSTGTGGNIAVGFKTLSSNLYGNSNTAVGLEALRLNNEGSNNTAIGSSALRSNYTASNNTAIGYNSMYRNTSGAQNSAIGVNSLFNNTSGNLNIAFGTNSLFSNTIGNNNVALGIAALERNISGSNNTASGYYALNKNTTGKNNTAIGDSTMYDNTIGYNNTAVGETALADNTTGTGNVAIGNATLRKNTINSGLVAIGDSALYDNGTGAIPSFNDGSANTAIGFATLKNNTIGANNTATGSKALYNNTTGNGNTANGTSALNKNSSGIGNTAIGFFSLLENTNGQNNTATGNNSLRFNNTGDYNTANGTFALNNNTTGNYNTALGFSTLSERDNNTECTAIGYDAETNTNLTNSTAIGARARVDLNNAMVLGSVAGVNGALASTNIGIGTTAPAERLHVAGITRIANNTNASAYGQIQHTGTPGGNLHIDTYGGGMYLNWFSGSGVVFGNGAAAGAQQFFPGGNVTIGGTLTQSSDVRLKKNILLIKKSLANLQNIKAYSYNWIDSKKDSSEQIGFLAQEVKKIYPQLVKEDDNGIMGINYSGLIPLLLTAIQEQQLQIDTLSKKPIQELMEENVLLKKQIELGNTLLQNQINELKLMIKK